MPKFEVSENLEVLHFFCHYNDRGRAKKCGGKWNSTLKSWDFIFNKGTVNKLVKEFINVDLPSNYDDLIKEKEDRIDFCEKIKIEAKKNVPIVYKAAGITKSLYSFQKHGVRFGVAAEEGVLIADEMGLGKAQDLTALVLCEYGWKQMKDIVVGDKAYGVDGELYDITGVYDQGLKDMYLVTFSDGTKTTSVESHLWSVQTTNDRFKKGYDFYGRVLELKDFKNDLYKSNGDYKYYNPINKSMKFRSYDLPLNPYLLGVLIGDGSITHKVKITTTDKEILKKVKDIVEQYGCTINNESKNSIDYIIGGTKGPKGYNYVRDCLEKLCLFHHRSEEKFIPKMYKFACEEDRIELLKGLLDTDGTVSKDGWHVSYNTSSYRLSEDVAELVRSLGGVAKIKDKKVNSVIGNYNIHIFMPQNVELFNLIRKKKLVKKKKKQVPHKSFKSVEYIGKRQARCISIDSKDQLYITDGYNVTHNTVQSIGIAMHHKIRRGAQKCLIVCPASLKYNWLNEINKFTNEPALVIEGDVSERELLWFDEAVFFKIVNYEIFARDLFYSKKVVDMVDGKEIYNEDKRIPRANILLDNWFDICLVDEIHYVKSHRALRTRALKKLKVEVKIGMTGTPLDGRLEELHSIYEFLKPGLFLSKTNFLKRHAKKNYFGAIEKYVKVDEVKEKISPYMIRRLKKQVCEDLPDKIFQDIYVEFPAATKDVYDDLVAGALEITEETEKIVKVIRARQFCDFPDIINLKVKSAKFEKLKELLEEIVSNENKVIIFSQYEQATRRIVEKVSKIYNVLYLHGGIDARERVNMCKQFNEDDSINAIIMTDAGSVGLNLQSASYVIHFDDNYSPSIMEQRTDRAHRIGQKNVVNVIRFICKDTIEERVRKILKDKDSVTKEVLDDDCAEMSLGRLSIKDLLELL